MMTHHPMSCLSSNHGLIEWPCRTEDYLGNSCHSQLARSPFSFLAGDLQYPPSMGQLVLLLFFQTHIPLWQLLHYLTSDLAVLSQIYHACEMALALPLWFSSLAKSSCCSIMSGFRTHKMVIWTLISQILRSSSFSFHYGHWICSYWKVWTGYHPKKYLHYP